MNHSDKPAIYALILCGGESRRMGSDKASLVYKGHSLLHHAKSIVVNAGVTEVFSVGGASHDIQDTKAFQGPAFATASALSTLRTSVPTLSSFIVLPVDMPLLAEHMLRDLLNNALTRKTSCYYEDQPFPFVLYHPFKHMPVLENLLSISKGPSIRRLLSLLNAEQIEPPVEGETSFFNVNSPTEWKQLKR
ncbi:molybdenum cofactor guanylyltransferase [Alteromonas sp. KUL49]|uniref:molybdenum cofactor guanylyltransferase n=1 Tax=Alteromonas sp. KUL49 TaxID=2480798 RepID=UPI00102F27AA|nr:molybdenum cofactor guanylyltransferase [Alteromonas sp. KUL49]TAP38962.1 molybdenum cofactor guanylyltransferase [Alteromonas sp. KUL49]